MKSFDELTQSFLDDSGLLHLWARLKEKFVLKTTKINSKALSSDIFLDADDVRAVPRSRTINGHQLNMNFDLDAVDVGAISGNGSLSTNVISDPMQLNIVEEKGIRGDLGKSWKETTMPESSWWRSTAYGNGRFVAVSNYGKAAYSADGKTWTATTVPGKSWNCVTFGDGKFVALGYSSDNAIYSTDGENWVDSVLPSSRPWEGVIFGGGKFLAVAEGPYAAYSENGINWTSTTLPTNQDVRKILAYGNGKFFAIEREINGKAYCSTDAITWTTVNIIPSDKLETFRTRWVAFTYGGGKFVALGTSGKFAWSTDGISWTLAESPVLDIDDIFTFQNITYGNGKFIAVGGQLTNKAAYSEDGTQWIIVDLPSTGEWTSVSYGDGKFVSVRLGSNYAACSIGPLSLWLNMNGYMVGSDITQADLSVMENNIVEHVTDMIDEVSGGVASFNGRSGVVVPQDGDYTAEQVGAAPAGHTHYIKGAFSIPTSGWGNDNTVGYPYYCDVAISGVTSGDRADVSIAIAGLTAASGCGLCPTSETFSGKIRFRARSIPTSAIPVDYFVTKGG